MSGASEMDMESSCRVCLSGNLEGDHVSLFQEFSTSELPTSLSNIGDLYEAAFGLAITAESWLNMPRFLCGCCVLQMRLFLKLKLKAHRTMELLLKQQKQTDDDTVAQHNEALEEEGEEETQEQPLADGVQPADDLIELVEENSFAPIQNFAVGFAEMYQEFVTSTAQRSRKKETTEIMSFIELPPNSELDDMEETTYYVTEEVYERVRQENEARSLLGQRQLLHNEEHNTEESNDAISNIVPYDHSAEQTTRPLVQSAVTQLRCFMCSKQFTNRTQLLQHRKDYHNNKYPCPECPKLFQSADALRVHGRLHSGTARFQCYLCGKNFNQKVHYKYHMNRHNNVRQFNCTQPNCGKSFLSKSDLAIHMRSHTGERPYFCELCGKDFLMLQHLKMHLYSHTAAKSFECGSCKQKFISPNTLRQHRISIHDCEPQFQCELCEKRFRRKHHLLAHYKVHGKVNAPPAATASRKDAPKDEAPSLDVVQKLLQQYDDEVEEITMSDIKAQFIWDINK